MKKIEPFIITEPSKQHFISPKSHNEFVIEVSHDKNYKGEWYQEQYLFIKVLSGVDDSEILAQKSFYTSYGKFKLILMDITGDSSEEFCLITGIGRGTNIRKETLVVYTLYETEFKPILIVPFSGYFGTGRWEYEFEWIDVNNDGLIDLRLVLNNDPIKESSLNNPHLLPEFSIQEFVWNKDEFRMIPVRQVKRKD